MYFNIRLELSLLTMLHQTIRLSYPDVIISRILLTLPLEYNVNRSDRLGCYDVR